MALLIPAGFAQITQHFTIAGDNEEILVTYGVATAGGPTPAQLADEAADHWIGVYPVGSMDNSLTYRGSSVRIGVSGGDPLIHRDVRANVGTNSGMSPPPQNVSILLTKQSAIGGRRGRGRMFLPSGFITASAISEIGIILSGTVTSLQTQATGLLTALETGPYQDGMVLLHSEATVWQLIGGQPRRVVDESAPAPPDPTPVTALTVSQLVATQRRRLRS